MRSAGPATVTATSSSARLAEVLAELRAQGVELRGATPFEVFRSKLGRRSRSQVESYDWVGDPAAVAAALDSWFEFGPADQPIVE